MVMVYIYMCMSNMHTYTRYAPEASAWRASCRRSAPDYNDNNDNSDNDDNNDHNDNNNSNNNTNNIDSNDMCHH